MSDYLLDLEDLEILHEIHIIPMQAVQVKRHIGIAMAPLGMLTNIAGNNLI